MLYGVKTKVESYHEDMLSYFLNKIDLVKFAWWFICKVTQWSHNPISVELLHERFIGFLYPKCHQKTQAIKWASTFFIYYVNLEGKPCEIYYKKNKRLPLSLNSNSKLQVDYYNCGKKSIYSQPSEIIVANKKINIVWCLGHKYNVPFNSGFVTLTLEAHPASVGYNAGVVREHQPLPWQ